MVPASQGSATPGSSHRQAQSTGRVTHQPTPSGRGPTPEARSGCSCSCAYRLDYRVRMGLPSAAAGDAPACPETQLASGTRAWTSRSFCRSKTDGCRYSCNPQPRYALVSREAAATAHARLQQSRVRAQVAEVRDRARPGSAEQAAADKLLPTEDVLDGGVRGHDQAAGQRSDHLNRTWGARACEHQAH